MTKIRADDAIKLSAKAGSKRPKRKRISKKEIDARRLREAKAAARRIHKEKYDKLIGPAVERIILAANKGSYSVKCSMSEYVVKDGQQFIYHELTKLGFDVKVSRTLGYSDPDSGYWPGYYDIRISWRKKKKRKSG